MKANDQLTTNMALLRNNLALTQMRSTGLLSAQAALAGSRTLGVGAVSAVLRVDARATRATSSNPSLARSADVQAAWAAVAEWAAARSSIREKTSSPR